MSDTVYSPSPKPPSGQRSGAAEGVVTTPNRRDAGAGTHSKRHHNQRHKVSTSGHHDYEQHNRAASTSIIDQENAASASAAGDESQDSAQALSSVKQRKKRGKNSNAQHRKDHISAAIPTVDGTMSPNSQPASSTPGSQGTHGTPSKQAYAGPTFHASPAASALPMPKFLSRSVPAGRPHSSLQAKLDDEVDQSDSSVPNNDEGNKDFETQRPKPPPREESPLDLFFNAHRAEQARQNSSDGLASLGRGSTQSLTPASAERLQHPYSVGPNSRYRQTNRPRSGTPSEKTMFMMELDGTGESDTSEDGRAPQTSFRDRLSAGRSTSGLSQMHSNHELDEEERQAKSQALKRLLMTQESPNTQQAQAINTENRSSSVDPFQRPSLSARLQGIPAHIPQVRGNGSGSGNGAQSTHTSERSRDVQTMENDLRRMLKLDS